MGKWIKCCPWTEIKKKKKDRRLSTLTHSLAVGKSNDNNTSLGKEIN